MSNNLMEIAGFIKTSTSDGKGIRSVLFLQGCSVNCVGCHNKGIARKGFGVTKSIGEIMKIIEANCLNKKITISGGEPLEQAKALAELILKLKDNGYDICLYTSYELEDVSAAILQNINSIKTGKFIIAMKDNSTSFYGSTNQKFTYFDK